MGPKLRYEVSEEGLEWESKGMESNGLEGEGGEGGEGMERGRDMLACGEKMGSSRPNTAQLSRETWGRHDATFDSDGLGRANVLYTVQ